MKLQGPRQRERARHRLQHTIRLLNHQIEHPDHFGAEHEASLKGKRAEWAQLDSEQRAESIALLKAERDLSIAASPRGVDYSGVGDLDDAAIARAVAYLEAED